MCQHLCGDAVHSFEQVDRLQENEMSAYLIFIRKRTLDQSELDAYAKAVGPSLEESPFKFLAAYGRQQVLEGPAPEGVAIAEFPSLEAAKQWYESPAYQAAAQHRFKGATYRGLIVEGV
jgi:uncharacterized protein (DUF1330 family)